MRKTLVALGGAAALAMAAGAPAYAHNTGDHRPKPTTTSSPTSPPPTSASPSPTPTHTAPAPWYKIWPRYFHAGDTLHIQISKCTTSAAAHSVIFTNPNVAFTKTNHTTFLGKGVVRSDLKPGKYKIYLSCKGVAHAVVIATYAKGGHGGGSGSGSGSAGSSGHQTTVVPAGGAQTGGGSTATTFVHDGGMSPLATAGSAAGAAVLAGAALGGLALRRRAARERS